MADDLKMYVERFTVSTGTGNKNFTLSAIGGDPVVGCMVLSNHCTADGTWTSIARFGIGAGTASDEYWYSTFHENDGQMTADNQSRAGVTAILRLDNAAGSTAILQATLSAFITNGVTLNFSVNDDSQPFIIIVFYVSSTISAFAGSATTVTTQDTAVDVTAPGFQPDVLFPFSFPFAGMDDNRVASPRFCVGAVLNDGVETQKSVNFRANESNPTSLGTVVSSTYSAVRILGSIDFTLETDLFDSSGFSVYTRLQSGVASKNFGYLAFGVDGLSTYLSVVDLPNNTDGTGNWSFNVGFQAGFFFLMTSMIETADTVDLGANAGNLCFGASDGSREYCMAINNKDNTSPSNVNSVCDNVVVNLRDGDDTQVYIGTLNSISSPNITINFTTVSTTNRKKAVLFALEQPSGNETLNQIIRRRLEDY